MESIIKDILNLKETAQYMGVSESYLYKLTHGKLIKHYKPTGKIIYFKKNDIEEFMLSNYQPTMVEVGNQIINSIKTK